MLKIEHIAKTFNPGTINEKKALRDLSLELADGEPTCSEKLHDWSYTIPHGTSYNGDYEKPCER